MSCRCTFILLANFRNTMLCRQALFPVCVESGLPEDAGWKKSCRWRVVTMMTCSHAFFLLRRRGFCFAETNRPSDRMITRSRSRSRRQEGRPRLFLLRPIRRRGLKRCPPAHTDSILCCFSGHGAKFRSRDFGHHRRCLLLLLCHLLFFRRHRFRWCLSEKNPG